MDEAEAADPKAFGIGATIVYCAVATAVILKAIDLVIGSRVAPRQNATASSKISLAPHGIAAPR